MPSWAVEPIPTCHMAGRRSGRSQPVVEALPVAGLLARGGDRARGGDHDVSSVEDRPEDPRAVTCRPLQCSALPARGSKFAAQRPPRGLHRHRWAVVARPINGPAPRSENVAASAAGRSRLGAGSPPIARWSGSRCDGSWPIVARSGAVLAGLFPLADALRGGRCVWRFISSRTGSGPSLPIEISPTAPSPLPTRAIGGRTAAAPWPPLSVPRRQAVANNKTVFG